MRAQDLDDIVQGLAVAKYALEAHDERAAMEAIDTTLASARRLLSGYCSGEDLQRSRPAG